MLKKKRKEKKIHLLGSEDTPGSKQEGRGCSVRVALHRRGTETPPPPPGPERPARILKQLRVLPFKIKTKYHLIMMPLVSGFWNQNHAEIGTQTDLRRRQKLIKWCFVATWWGMAAHKQTRDLLTMQVCCQAIMACLKQASVDSGYMLKFIKLLNMLC